MTKKKISARALKPKLFELLKAPNFDPALEKILQIPAFQVINSLFSFLYNENPETKWNAVTAMGAMVSKLAQEDMESAREVVRRLMWNLNDESGGIGWGSPEAMGEILASQEGLAMEYSPILLSYARENGNFQELETMQRGVLWGIGRLAQIRPGLLKDASQHIIPYLKSPDATVRGLAAWITGLLGAEDARQSLEQLLEDENPIRIYLDRSLVECRVKELAVEALKRLSFEG